MDDSTGSNLTATLKGNVITLTPAEGKLLPSAVTSIAMIGTTTLTENTHWVYDKTTGTITLNTKITGKITVTAVATELIDIYTLEITANTGAIGVKDGEKQDVTITTNDKIVYLKSADGVEEILKGLTKDMAFAQVCEALGIPATGDYIQAGAASDNAVDRANEAKAFILFIDINEGNVVGVGLVVNTSEKTD